MIQYNVFVDTPYVVNTLQFIEDRLDRLNSGKQTSDEFELEISVHCEKSSSKMRQQYKQFVTNFRKEGGAIMKSVKSKVRQEYFDGFKGCTYVQLLCKIHVYFVKSYYLFFFYYLLFLWDWDYLFIKK